MSVFPLFFFFNDTATTEIYTLSLHDALPISTAKDISNVVTDAASGVVDIRNILCSSGSAGMPRSEERFSRNAETDLVCRLLLEKKKKQKLTLPKRHTPAKQQRYNPAPRANHA